MKIIWGNIRRVRPCDKSYRLYSLIFYGVVRAVPGPKRSVKWHSLCIHRSTSSFINFQLIRPTCWTKNVRRCFDSVPTVRDGQCRRFPAEHSTVSFSGANRVPLPSVGAACLCMFTPYFLTGYVTHTPFFAAGYQTVQTRLTFEAGRWQLISESFSG